MESGSSVIRPKAVIISWPTVTQADVSLSLCTEDDAVICLISSAILLLSRLKRTDQCRIQTLSTFFLDMLSRARSGPCIKVLGYLFSMTLRPIVGTAACDVCALKMWAT